MPTSWQVRTAALLVGLGLVPASALLVSATRLLHRDAGYLFFLLPILAAALAISAVFLATASLLLSVRIWTGGRGARLHAALFGGVLFVTALCTWAIQPWVGLLILVQSMALVALMFTAAAKRELHGWIEGLKPRAN